MDSSNSPGDADTVAARVSDIAASLGRRVDELSATVTGVLEDEIPDLRTDPELRVLLAGSVHANIETVLRSLEHGDSVRDLQVPAAASEFARRLAQYGVAVTSLVRAYRLGQTTVIGVFFDEVRRTDLEPRLALSVSQRFIAVVSEYIDWVSQQVVSNYERERDRWLANRSSVRAVRVQEILAGKDHPDIDTSIRYPLRQNHLAAIVWVRQPQTAGDELAVLEQTARELSAVIGGRGDPLFVAIDRITGWIWIPLGHAATAPDLAALRQHLSSRRAELALALGAPASGIEGFRASHRQAETARKVALAGEPNMRAVTAFDDVGVSTVALLVDDIGRTRAWVLEVLGGLARDTDNAARLRETLRVFLGNQSSNIATGKALNLHYNSVKYRIKRAAEERGSDRGHDRLDVELALLICHWLGTAVLA